MHLFSKNKNSSKILKKSQDRANIHTKAFRDWKVFLLSAIVIAFVIAGLDGYLLWRVNYGDVFMSTNSGGKDTTTTDEKVLADVVKIFDDRQASFEAWKSMAPSEIDPSF